MRHLHVISPSVKTIASKSVFSHKFSTGSGQFNLKMRQFLIFGGKNLKNGGDISYNRCLAVPFRRSSYLSFNRVLDKAYFLSQSPNRIAGNIEHMRKFQTSVPVLANERGKERLPHIKFNVSGVDRLEDTDRYWMPWLTTMEGRQNIAYGVFGIAAAVIIACFLMEVSFINRSREKYEEKSESSDEDEKSRTAYNTEFNKIVAMNHDRLNLKEDTNMEKLEMFLTYMLDPVIFGSTNSKEGAIIGLPRHIFWKSPEDVELSKFRVKPYFNPFFNGYEIPESTDKQLVDELKSSLVLSEEARKFIICKLVNQAGSYQLIFNIVLPGMFILFHHMLGVNVNQTMKLFEKPRPLRLAIQSVILVCMIATFIGASSLVKESFEQSAVESAIKSAEDARAGVEYFTSVLKRNKAIADILGEKESAYYFTKVKVSKEDSEHGVEEEFVDVIANFYELPEHVGAVPLLLLCRQRLKELSK